MFYHLKSEVLNFVAPELVLTSAKITKEQIFGLLEKPRSFEHGHLALPVFVFAKEAKQNPNEYSLDLEKKLTAKILGSSEQPQISSVKALGGFINFTFRARFLKTQIQSIAESPLETLGHSNTFQGKTMIIDYASPNVAKSMHIGHLRATVIGESLRRLAQTQSYKVIGVNHLGDWGTQFGGLAWAIDKWSTPKEFEADPIKRLDELYVKFNAAAKEDPEIAERGAETFRLLENGDPKVVAIWKQVIAWSLVEYERLFKLLRVHHDLVLGESFYFDKQDDVVNRLTNKGILVESEGARVVMFADEDKMPPCIVKKSDGSSIYATRDLACAIYRHEVLKGDLLLYVVGQDQSLHFRQIFKVLEKMEYSWAKDCHHISFGAYRFKEGKMSSRVGKIVRFQDVLDRALDLVSEQMRDRPLAEADKSKIARQVSVGAIIFNDLLQDRNRNTEFDWDKVLSFEGDSGPYLQYTVVRCRSLLKKFATEVGTPLNWDFQREYAEPAEIKLMITLLQLDHILQVSFKNFKPNLLAQYLLELSADFSQFYLKCRILGESPEVAMSRICLVSAMEKVLVKGLDVLNIEAPDQM